MQKGHTAFFYGTLMHPKILMRVIASDASHLRLCPAILFDYTRHKVKFADYPGIVPLEKSRLRFKPGLSAEDKRVRGMLVTGLTDGDIAALDIYEGAEYDRVKIKVYPLDDWKDITAHAIHNDALHLTHTPPLSPEQVTFSIFAETYIFSNYETDLEDDLWSYDDFVRQNAWKWYGRPSHNREDILEVERRRAAGSLYMSEGVIHLLCRREAVAN